MYIRSIKIRNLRCFEETQLEFQYPGREQSEPPRLPNINLLLGNNGAGKTTVLKAIALAVLSPVIAQSGFVPYRLVRRVDGAGHSSQSAETDAQVILHSQDVETGRTAEQTRPAVQRMGVKLSRKEDYESLIPHLYKTSHRQATPYWHRMHEDSSAAFLVVGYGASRRIEDGEKIDLGARRKVRLLRYERVAGLFENHVSLIPLSAWLPGFQKENPGRHKQVINLLNRLLPDGTSFAGEYERGEYLFEINGVKAPFGALSDGYRAYIGWIADLLYHICMGAPRGAKLVDNYGIVLVDEIDLHLHPEWQRSVIPTIAKALPNLQFVFTTHSPIVAGSLQKENIFVMETTEDGASVVKQYDERIYGLNAEQVLRSSYFNLKTTRAEPFVDELKTLSVKAGKGDLNAALAFMEKLSGQENGHVATVETNSSRTSKAAGQRTKKKAVTVKAKKRK